MNAFEQIKSLAAIGKIEAVVYLFRTEFPEVLADLKPWIKSNEAQQFSDPDSIDIGFHFPNVSHSCRCHTVLMQVKLNKESDKPNGQGDSPDRRLTTTCPDRGCASQRVIGINLSGYGAYEEQWQFSTVEYWEFSGISTPTLENQMSLKRICHQILELFND